MDESNKTLSRRQAVGLVGMGIASAATGSAIAQQAAGSSSIPPSPTKGDPRAKYPKPPFQEQTQAWPGLAGKMNPKPDHGEITYRGSGRLAGRKALITGADSGMGRAAAIAYANNFLLMMYAALLLIPLVLLLRGGPAAIVLRTK